jgi:hypothetical protein
VNDIWAESEAYVRRTLDELQDKSWTVLKDLPDYTHLPSPEGLGKFTFGLWKHGRADGSLRIIVQRYRRYVLGFGRISADGFVVRDNGSIEPVPKEEMWEYM